MEEREPSGFGAGIVVCLAKFSEHLSNRHYDRIQHHGFTEQIWTKETVEEIRRLWQEACLALDERLGVTADWGTW